MFSLIISIIAIALVIVLAGASLYYGGDAFNKGTAKGEAAKYVNEAQQLQAAVTMYKVDNKGKLPTDIASLEGDYLSADLSGGWEFQTGGAADGVQTASAADAVSDEVCAIIADETKGIRASNKQINCATGSVTYDF